jgi:hypothetical protein
MKNLVFRSIDDRWRGPLPCSGSEASAGLVVGLLLPAPVQVVAGAIAGIALIAAVVAGGRLDHDGSYYLFAFVRRLARKRGDYNANEPDRFVAFDPR